MKEAGTDAARRTAGQVAGDVSRDWLALIATGLGLSISGVEFLGGILLAIGGGALVAHVRRKQHPEHERFAWWFTLVAAAFFGTLAGQASPHLLPGWPPQVAMALAGMASRALVLIVIDATDAGVTEAPNIMRRIIDAIFNRRGPGGGV
ncbi:hypothetical protein DLJ49_18730 [Rhodovulum sp. 12E13]|uniref:hypothetical protein n=1 Tax=Rhodovulum sp. 12E13 TaxID=2203891 RepID=UPI000E1275C8|nr:hypothetical protein [Rhodovulum sp. 12E13]RDC69675.1 hypothetical protein DLJ49_18730 [Rhodovulum sp. 12E13]